MSKSDPPAPPGPVSEVWKKRSGQRQSDLTWLDLPLPAGSEAPVEAAPTPFLPDDDAFVPLGQQWVEPDDGLDDDDLPTLDIPATFGGGRPGESQIPEAQQDEQPAEAFAPQTTFWFSDDPVDLGQTPPEEAPEREQPAEAAAPAASITPSVAPPEADRPKTLRQSFAPPPAPAKGTEAQDEAPQVPDAGPVHAPAPSVPAVSERPVIRIDGSDGGGTMVSVSLPTSDKRAPRLELQELIVRALGTDHIIGSLGDDTELRIAADDVAHIAVGRLERIEPGEAQGLFAKGFPVPPAHLLALLGGEASDGPGSVMRGFVVNAAQLSTQKLLGLRVPTGAQSVAALAKQLFLRYPRAAYVHGTGRFGAYNLPVYSGLREFLARLHDVAATGGTRDQAGGG